MDHNDRVTRPDPLSIGRPATNVGGIGRSRPAHHPHEDRGQGRRSRLGPWCVALAALVAHAPSIRCEFTNWDDTAYVHNNPLNRDLSGLWRIWTTAEAPQYYPLTFTTFWIEHQLWGTHAAGYHAVNVALHGLNAALVTLLLARLGLTPGCATAVALVFAVSPVQVMSVAWVAERKNVLSTLFGLLSLLAAVQFFREGRRRPFALMLAAFLASLLAKSAWAVLPAVAWAAGRWVLRAEPRRVLAAVVPMLLLAAGPVWITSRVEQTYLDAFVPAFWDRVRIAPGALLWYAATTLAPLRLSPHYPAWDIDPRSPLAWLVPLSLAVLCLLLAWNWRRLRPIERWGMFTFVVFLLPVIGLVAYGNLGVSWVSDHYLYAACIGLYAAVVSAAAARFATARRGKRAAGAIVAALTIAGVVASWRQIPIWRDDLTLWQNVLERDPDSLVGYVGRGKAWVERKDFDAAVADYRRVLEHRPDLVLVRADLGQFLIAAGRFDEAGREFEIALPTHPHPHEVFAHLGVAQERGGHIEAAIESFRRAIHAAPDYAVAHARLGELLARLGRHRQAADAFRLGLDLAGDVGRWRLTDGLARILATANDPAVHDPPTAVRLAEENARRLRRPSPESLDTLMLALAAAGRFGEALAVGEQAIALFRQRGATDRVEILQRRAERLRAQAATRPSADLVSPSGR